MRIRELRVTRLGGAVEVVTSCLDVVRHEVGRSTPCDGATVALAVAVVRHPDIQRTIVDRVAPDVYRLTVPDIGEVKGIVHVAESVLSGTCHIAKPWLSRRVITRAIRGIQTPARVVVVPRLASEVLDGHVDVLLVPVIRRADLVDGVAREDERPAAHEEPP